MSGVNLQKPVEGGVHLEKPVQNEVQGGVHLEKPVEQPVQNGELSGVQLEKPVENIQAPNGLENQNQFSKYTSGIFDGKNINIERVHEVENIVNNTLEDGLNNVLGKLGNTMEGVTNKFNDFLNGLDK